MTTVTAKKVLLKDEFGTPIIPYTENKGVYELFDTKIVDHILTGSEATGWALQGTYTLPSDVDFYNRCQDEYNQSELTNIWVKNNIIPYGAITQTNHMLSNFSADNYVTLNLTSNSFLRSSWTMYVKFRLTANNIVNPIVSSLQNYGGLNIYLDKNGKLNVYISDNGTSWYSEINNSRIGTHVYAVDTDYWLKISCSSSSGTYNYSVQYSTDGKTYTTDWYEQIMPAIYGEAGQFVLGRDFSSNFLHGTIDLSQTNLSRGWQGSTYLDLYKHVNGHVYYDIKDKELIDDIFNRTGLAWYYGVDLDNQRIFLQRNSFYPEFNQQEKYVLMPDWNRALTGITFPYTAQEDGWFVFADNSHSYTVQINGVQVSKSSFSADNWPGQGHVQVAVKKGDLITCSRSSLDNCSYVPMYKIPQDGIHSNDAMKLLYICVGNALIKSSVIDAETAVGEIRHFETNKANIDLDNLSKVGKSNVTDILSPDYTAGIEKVWGQTYTAEVSGWLYYAIRFATTTSSTIDDYTCLWIDEIPISIAGGQKGTSASANSGLVKIAKGSTYRTANPDGTGYSTQCIRFYPDKGAN